MKTEEILENELIPRDTSVIGKMADQLARAAFIENKGNIRKTKEHAARAANNAHSIMLKRMDEIIDQLATKEIK